MFFPQTFNSEPPFQYSIFFKSLPILIPNEIGLIIDQIYTKIYSYDIFNSNTSLIQFGYDLHKQFVHLYPKSDKNDIWVTGLDYNDFLKIYN